MKGPLKRPSRDAALSSLEQDERLFLSRFERAEFEPGQFGHVEHVRAAWLLLRVCAGPEEALWSLSTGLKRLTERHGAPEHYHATVTWAFFCLIAERSAEEESWKQFEARNRGLFSSRPSPLAAFYSAEQLASEEARFRFLLPVRSD